MIPIHTAHYLLPFTFRVCIFLCTRHVTPFPFHYALPVFHVRRAGVVGINAHQHCAIMAAQHVGSLRRDGGGRTCPLSWPAVTTFCPVYSYAGGVLRHYRLFLLLICASKTARHGSRDRLWLVTNVDNLVEYIFVPP